MQIKDVAVINEVNISSKYPYSDIEYIDTSSVTEGRFEKLQHIKLKDAPSRAKRLVKHNDILISTVRPNLRHFGILKKPSDKMVASTGFAVITCKKVYPDYLYRLLTTDGYTNYLSAIADSQQSNYPAFNPSLIENTQINLPPLSIQKKIAAILSAYDDLIEKNNRRISILEKMAEELYKEWFVRLRFPGYKKTKIKNGIPEGWEVKRLGDVCIKITDGSHTSPSFFEGGYFMASVKDMTAYGFNFSEMKTISEADFDKLVKMDCKPLKNDVLIAKDGSYLKHVFVWDSNEEVVILSSIAILRPNIQEIQPYFFALTLKQDSVKNMMTGFVSGSALPRIILKAFKEMKILVPQNSVMEQFENIIKPVYKNIRTLLDTISNLTSTRDRLLSRLLSGKIDVENLDIKFPDSMKEDS